MHHDRSIDRPIVVLRFADLPQFLNTLNWENLSFQHTRQCTESVALRQVLAPLWAARKESKWKPRTRQDRSLRRRVVQFTNGFSINPTLHHLFFRNPHVIFFQWIYVHTKTLQGCIHVAPVIWPILSLNSSPKPCWTWARAMYGSCSCALRRWREPRWLCLPVCLFSLPCHGVVFAQFLVLPARSSSFDLRHRPSNLPGSASPPQVAQSFQ